MATSVDLVVTRWGARFAGRTMPCAIGRGGIGVKRREGDGITPVGSFRMLRVYARPDRVWHPRATPVRMWQVWSDDPDDPDYNRPLPSPRAGLSHERLWRADPLYDLVVDIDYNRTPPVSGAGSCIFLHVWRGPRRPTEGCVAFARHDLEAILDRWTPRSRVIIRG